MNQDDINVGGILFWTVDSEADKKYETTTWCRCVGGEEFVKKIIRNGHKIVGIVFEGNNISFILDSETEQTHGEENSVPTRDTETVSD